MFFVFFFLISNFASKYSFIDLLARYIVSSIIFLPLLYACAKHYLATHLCYTMLNITYSYSVCFFFASDLFYRLFSAKYSCNYVSMLRHSDHMAWYLPNLSIVLRLLSAEELY